MKQCILFSFGIYLVFAAIAIATNQTDQGNSSLCNSSNNPTSGTTPTKAFATCASALGYTLAVPLTCLLVMEHELNHGLKLAACSGGFIYGLGQIAECICSICNAAQTHCAGC